ncbi:MAG TPA: mandelate racemase/muconate lactonizing enzyme family protein [Puia sp.]|jgi:L-alanine-DL-glutamate epimerase-like enolase superfamily enzyme
MSNNRRKFLSNVMAGGLGAAAVSLPFCKAPATRGGNDQLQERYAQLDAVLAKPIFKKELFPDPVIIESLELIHYQGSFICHIRSRDGAEGYSVAHGHMRVLYPIFVDNLQPFFINQDARRLDELMEKAYVYNLNYRCKGYALGIPVATIEFAILDMMGRIAGKSMGELIGSIHNTHVSLYQATEWRAKPLDESLALIKQAVTESKAKALKIKVGALMWETKDIDARGPAGRTEQIIPLMRKTFGDDFALYADANGYYGVEDAIRVGKLLAEYKYSFFEEPVQYDWLERTKQVKDAVQIPIAGGEQQHGIEEFRWYMAHQGLDVVQPDQYYFGGMLRSSKVARMAELMGKQCTPHLTDGFGFIYMMHFMSTVPNAGAHIEFKGYANIPIECKTSSLKLENGKIKVPTGPGSGVDIDPDFIRKHVAVQVL